MANFKTHFTTLFYDKTARALVWVGLPIMVQYLLTSSVGLISSIMAGGLGEKSVAALGIGNQFFFVYSLLIFGLFAGASVLMAQLHGAGDLSGIRKTIAISSLIGVLIGLLFFLIEKTSIVPLARLFAHDSTVIASVKAYMDAVIFSYLLLPIFLAFSAGFRATKRSGRPMYISMVGVAVNVGFTWLFLNGLGSFNAIGLLGVGYATVLSRAVELLIMLIMAKSSNLSISLSTMKTLTPSIALQVMKIATPVMINELCWGMGMVIYNILYSSIGLEALTAVQIASVLQSFYLTFIFGVSGAAAIIIGNAIGAKEETYALEASNKIIWIAMPISAITGAAMVLSGKLLLPYYDITTATVYNFVWIIGIASLLMPIKFYAILMITGVLRGGGDTLFTMYLELATMWLIGVPLAFLAVKVLLLPVYAAFAIVFIEDFIKCLLARQRYHSKRWVRNIADY